MSPENNIHTETAVDVETVLAKLKIARFGGLAISSSPVGFEVNNDALVQMIMEEQPPGSDFQEDKVRRKIERTGMTMRRQLIPFGSTLESVVETSALIGGVHIEALKAEKGWESFDVLINTSASLPTEVGAAALKRAGIDPENIMQRSYRIACAGALSAFVDCLADPQLANKRVVIIAIEPLSRHVTKGHFLDMDTLAIPAIFGDDFAAMAFDTSEFELIAARTAAASDHGAFRLYKDYQLPPNDPDVVPRHYSIEAGDEHIFSVTSDGVFIEIEEPQGNLLSEMDGLATFKHLVGRAPREIKKVFEEAQEQTSEPLQTVGHQPSEAVHVGLGNQLLEQLPGLEMQPFFLGEIGRSNASSATTPIVMQHSASNRLIDPDRPLLVYSLGIGATIVAAVVKAK